MASGSYLGGDTTTGMEGLVSMQSRRGTRIGLDGLDWRLWLCKDDNGHAHCSRRSESTDCLGENPGGNLGTVQANPCCWLTPIGP